MSKGMEYCAGSSSWNPIELPPGQTLWLLSLVRGNSRQARVLRQAVVVNRTARVSSSPACLSRMQAAANDGDEEVFSSDDEAHDLELVGIKRKRTSPGSGGKGASASRFRKGVCPRKRSQESFLGSCREEGRYVPTA